jgi:hypothetical protein
MKKRVFTCLVSIVCVSTFVCGSFAQEVMTLSGRDYTVFMLCLDDAGNYYSTNQNNQDEFQFQDNGDFKITDLENQKDLIDSSSGSYVASATKFSGDYEITIGNRLKKYTFSFSGISLVNTIILGQFVVTYFEFDGFPPDYNKKGEAQAYFLGFSK